MTPNQIQRYCIKDGAQMHLIDGAIYEGIAECPTCHRLEQLECGGHRVITAAQAAVILHDSGFRANCNGAEFDPARPAAWQTGWLDAHDLGAFAPIEWFRLEAEVQPHGDGMMRRRDRNRKRRYHAASGLLNPARLLLVAWGPGQPPGEGGKHRASIKEGDHE